MYIMVYYQYMSVFDSGNFLLPKMRYALSGAFDLGDLWLANIDTGIIMDYFILNYPKNCWHLKENRWYMQ